MRVDQRFLVLMLLRSLRLVLPNRRRPLRTAHVKKDVAALNRLPVYYLDVPRFRSFNSKEGLKENEALMPRCYAARTGPVRLAGRLPERPAAFSQRSSSARDEGHLSCRWTTQKR